MGSIMHDSTDMNMSQVQGTVNDRGAWRAAVHRGAAVGRDDLAA